eukprot:gene1763-2911_t
MLPLAALAPWLAAMASAATPGMLLPVMVTPTYTKLQQHGASTLYTIDVPPGS